jgi:iron complex transport system permease protein
MDPSVSGAAAALVGVHRQRRRRLVALLALPPLLVCAMVLSIRVGAADLSLADVIAALGGRLVPDRAPVSPRLDTIVWVLRLPRVLTAVVGGATLGMTGSLVQAVLRNPLATPYTLGVSASAGFGAALGLVLGVGVLPGTAGVVINAFLFSLLPASVVLIAGLRARVGGETMILAGVAVSYTFAALTTLLHFIADDDALRNAVFWLVGDLGRAALWQVPYLLAALLVLSLVALRLAPAVSLLAFSDEEATALGVAVERTRRTAIVSACLATAAVIAFTGPIGFIGLLAPQLARLAVGVDERFRLPMAGLTGALLLVGADLVARTVVAPIVLPVGAVTAVLGGPVLLWFLLRRPRRPEDR